MELESVKLETTWNEAARVINENSQRIKTEITRLKAESGGGDSPDGDYVLRSGDSMTGSLRIQAQDTQLHIIGDKNEVGDYRAQITAGRVGEFYGGIYWNSDYTNIEGASGHLTYNDEPLVSILELDDTPVFTTVDNEQKIVQLRDRGFRAVAYPITRPEAVVDEEGRNILEVIDASIKGSSEEDTLMYGVERCVTVADTTMTRIGNMVLHRQLPIQSRMKGCLLDDNGNVVEYLNPATWEDAVRDGSKGQVMVEIPEHYRKFETEGNIRRAKISEYPLPGYHYVPKMYISAYEATVQRSTNKLCSVVNASTDYRGGGNQADWDGTFRSMLGHPATAIKHSVFRAYARNRNASETSEWNMLVYDAYQTMVWLYFVEYANLNCQLAVKGKDVNGYSQGGLGKGFTYTKQANAFSYFPILPCGVTDSLGNGSGEVAVQVMNESGAVAETQYACRYRGVENPFGHMETYVDGVLGVGVDGDVAWYFSDDTSTYSSSNADGYQNYGRMTPAQACVKNIIFGDRGDILCTETGASTSTYFCDYVDITAVTDGAVRPMLLGGGPTHGVNAGFLFTTCKYSDTSGNGFGTRLCFIPKNE